MGQRRDAKTEGLRRWDHDVAHADDLEEHRAWVVWGVGAASARAAEPERAERPGEPGNEVAREIAAGRDPDWARIPEPDRWVIVLEADEDDVDTWVRDEDDARGYAAYLMERRWADAEPQRMRGVLRGDRVKRRPFDAGRPE